jgi:hypothetical protein
MTTLHSRKSICRWPSRLGLLLVPLVLVCFALSPTVQAVTPAPDGGYPGNNAAEGTSALFSLTTGTNNTAGGSQSLYFNTSGSSNTAAGFRALFHNTTGNANTASGDQALQSNTTGAQNTACGFNALINNITGHDNTALGFNAGKFITGSNNIDIGEGGVAGENGVIRIGHVTAHFATFIAGISVATVAGEDVHVNPNGQLGVSPSSRRFKDEIKPMDKASEAILALKPVTFHYKKEIDPKSTERFGLVAEEVEKVNPDLVSRDAQGKPFTVRYDAVNAMLLNEFLKEHWKVQQLEKQVEALTAGLQKVSAQLEATKPAPQVVNNP